MECTLQQIRNFARKHRATIFNTMDGSRCLIAQYMESIGLKYPEYAGQGAYRHRSSEGLNATFQSPPEYDAGICQGRLDSDSSPYFTGAQLEHYLTRLIKGNKSPKDCAKGMTGKTRDEYNAQFDGLPKA